MEAKKGKLDGKFDIYIFYIFKISGNMRLLSPAR